MRKTKHKVPLGHKVGHKKAVSEGLRFSSQRAFSEPGTRRDAAGSTARFFAGEDSPWGRLRGTVSRRNERQPRRRQPAHDLSGPAAIIRCMGKGKRLREARRNERESDAVPGNFRAGVERMLRLMSELSAGKDLDTAINERRAIVQAAVRGMDTANALGQVVLSEAIQFADGYAESTSPGQAYVVELVAAELLAQADDLPALATTEASVLAVARNVREAAHEAVFLEGLRRYPPTSDGVPESAGERNTRGRAALKHLMLRNPGWPWQ